MTLFRLSLLLWQLAPSMKAAVQRHCAFSVTQHLFDLYSSLLCVPGIVPGLACVAGCRKGGRKVKISAVRDPPALCVRLSPFPPLRTPATQAIPGLDSSVLQKSSWNNNGIYNTSLNFFFYVMPIAFIDLYLNIHSVRGLDTYLPFFCWCFSVNFMSALSQVSPVVPVLLEQIA